MDDNTYTASSDYITPTDMHIALKGSPEYSIDSNGIMTINTTWIVTPLTDTSGRATINWLAFETEVEEWAGDVGDAYKQPVIPEGMKEATAYTLSTLFKVDAINFNCAEGRTHYEVTYTNVQNFSEMRQIGNVSADIDENNEITKTITYQIDVGSGPMAIDAHFLKSGETVAWAGNTYLISNSSYNAVSATRYELTITAKDMAKMMIGKPSMSVDAFGQRTMTVSWRYSNEAYAELEANFPEEGSDASPYFKSDDSDNSDYSGYILTDISVEPNGVIGYTVTFNAKHVTKRLIKDSISEKRKTDGDGYYTEHTIQYTSDTENVDEFRGLVGNQVSSFINGASGKITDVSIEESGRNAYDIQITASTEPAANEKNSDDLSKQVDVSMSQTSFVLEEKQTGWFKGLSGEYYMINFPPRTRYSYTQSVSSLQDMNSPVASNSAILTAIQTKGTIGYDRIVAVQKYVKGVPKWLSDEERKALYSLDNIHTIRLEGFVYAQPTMTEGDKTLRNILFEAWDVLEDSPVFLADRGSDDRDKPLPKKFITYAIKVMEIQVSMNYKGDSRSILKKQFRYYYDKAINYIESNAFTSYKGAGISISEIKDEESNIWTQVTCSIKALLSDNTPDLKWNPGYDGSYVRNKGDK